VVKAARVDDATTATARPLFLGPGYSLDDMRIVITGRAGFVGQSGRALSVMPPLRRAHHGVLFRSNPIAELHWAA
jgi:hypothetical protein